MVNTSKFYFKTTQIEYSDCGVTKTIIYIRIFIFLSKVASHFLFVPSCTEDKQTD